MITIRKLQSLPDRTRVRKIIRLLDGIVQYGSFPARPYMLSMLALIPEDLTAASAALPSLRIALEGAPHDLLSQTLQSESQKEHESAADSPEAPKANLAVERSRLVRLADALRYELRTATGEPVADWDLLPPAGYGRVKPEERPSRQSPISLYLESVRSPFNMGSIIRTAAALGVSRIGLSPDCPPEDHPRVCRSAMGADRHVRLERLALSSLDATWQPLVALEPGGTPIDSYAFPERGTMLIGSEELGLSAAALAAAVARISVPLSGVKGSINVGVACGIALYRWVAAVGTASSV